MEALDLELERTKAKRAAKRPNTSRQAFLPRLKPPTHPHVLLAASLFYRPLFHVALH